MKTILVVDDEFALVDSLADLLQDAGYRVVTASNGKDGLVKAITERPDLVLTDFMMPISGGGELIDSLRKMPAFRSLPVVVMSGSQQEIAIDPKSRTSKAVWFLGKPFHVDQVLDLVQRLIGK